MNKLTKKVFQNPIYFFAFGFGSGLSPILPGTMGTLAAIPLYLALIHYSFPIYLLVTLIAFIFGIFICDKVTNDIGEQDYQGIVWDEIVGYLLTMFGAPKGSLWVILGFLLFRLFDIWKPKPIGWFDKHIKGGLGIMLDDVIAAFFAFACMQGIIYLTGVLV